MSFTSVDGLRTMPMFRRNSFVKRWGLRGLSPHHYSGSKSSDTEFMQYRLLVGGGPSSKICPKCDAQRPQSTSVLSIPTVWSSLYVTLLERLGWKKLGHPQVLA